MERSGNTPFFVVCGMMLRFVGRGRGFYLGFKGVYQGLGMGMVWLLSDSWVTVRRHRPIVARCSPDYHRHFNRWKTKITYSNIPSTGLITRLFTLKNRIWGHYIPVKARDEGYITYSGASGVAASISSKLLNDNHIIFIVLCPGTNGYRGRRQVFFVA